MQLRSLLKPYPSRRQSSGRSSRCASVCRLLAGWNRTAEFELAWDDWAEFGLTWFSASPGLDELKRAELASVGRMVGRFPFVAIQDANAANG